MKKLIVMLLISITMYGSIVEASEVSNNEVDIGSVGDSLIARTLSGVVSSESFVMFEDSPHEYTKLCNTIDFVNASFGKPDYILIQDLHESQYLRAYKSYALYQFGSEFVCVDIQECMRTIPNEDDKLEIMCVGIIKPQVTITVNNHNIQSFINDKETQGYVLVDNADALRELVGIVK